MKSRVQKWGNSLAIRIPKSFAEEAGLKDDTPVEITLAEGKVVFTPVKRKSRVTLQSLLDQITPETLHTEIDTGGPVGNELW